MYPAAPHIYPTFMDLFLGWSNDRRMLIINLSQSFLTFTTPQENLSTPFISSVTGRLNYSFHFFAVKNGTVVCFFFTSPRNFLSGACVGILLRSRLTGYQVRKN